ncbi:MAG: FtsH protease activity modulator HflK [Candidatus Atribacteria bacterium]|nr:FtsH protease activity modulator HflK [Candidatus Atribacteria bacterium]
MYEDFEGKVINIYNSRILRFLKKLGSYLGLILLAIYLLSGIYVVGPDEVGVIKRLGSFVGSVPPGIHYHLPYPFETVTRPKITEVRRVEVGFRTIHPGPPARYELRPEESLMLTGDENIVSCQYIVQYRISDPYRYLFNIKNPEMAVKSAAEAAMREVVGKKTIDEVLTVGRAEIQAETMVLLQEILDRYNAGLRVIAVQLQDVQPPQEVMSAFKDVASAREDRARFINEAQAYQNQIIPQARGEAAQIIKEAEAFRETRIREAEGETERFRKLLEEYRLGKVIVQERLSLEVLQKVFSKTRKFVFDSEDTAKEVLKLLPLYREEGVRGNE